jgi:Family of unknown function (DUF5898)
MSSGAQSVEVAATTPTATESIFCVVKLVFENLEEEEQQKTIGYLRLSDIYDVLTHTVCLGGFRTLPEHILHLAAAQLEVVIPPTIESSKQLSAFRNYEQSIRMIWSYGGHQMSLNTGMGEELLTAALRNMKLKDGSEFSLMIRHWKVGIIRVNSWNPTPAPTMNAQPQLYGCSSAQSSSLLMAAGGSTPNLGFDSYGETVNSTDSLQPSTLWNGDPREQPRQSPATTGAMARAVRFSMSGSSPPNPRAVTVEEWALLKSMVTQCYADLATRIDVEGTQLTAINQSGTSRGLNRGLSPNRSRRKRDDSEDNTPHKETWRHKSVHVYSLKQIFNSPVTRMNCTKSGPHLPKNHDAAVRVHAFTASRVIGEALLSEDSIPPEWASVQENSCGNIEEIHHETEVEYHVLNLLNSMLLVGHLGHRYWFKSQLSLDKSRCDLVLVQKSNVLPIAIVEVKKPGQTSHQNDQVFGRFEGGQMTMDGHGGVAGQLYDQLVGLKMNGSQIPIGLLTNGNLWQMVMIDAQLPGTETQVAASAGPTSSAETPAHIDLGATANDLSAKESPTALLEAADRVIYVSDVVNVEEGVRLGKFIEAVIHLMIKSAASQGRFKSNLPRFSTPVRILDHTRNDGRCCIVAMVNGRALPRERSHFYPNAKISLFYLVQPLGQGVNGSFCKAIGSDGSVCVVKFFFRNTEGSTDTKVLDEAHRECSCWNKLFKHLFRPHFCNVHERRTTGEIHLMMPLVEVVEKKDRQKLLGEAKVLLKKFASEHYRMDVIDWCQLGLSPAAKRKQPHQLLLVDLGAVTSLSRDDCGAKDKEEWVETTWKRLKDTIDM